MLSRGPIFRDPLFDFTNLRLPGHGTARFPLNHPDLYLSGYGRVALWQGLQHLNLKSGDAVLVPNYICNAVLAPLHRLGLKAAFYEVDDQLRPDWQKVQKQLGAGLRAMIIVNYFGFPNALEEARKFCDKQNIFLIEDNAHGFLSNDGQKPLGTFGDISIFSFRKTIPLSDGAGLLINFNTSKEKNSFLKLSENPVASVRFLIKCVLLRVLMKNEKGPSKKDLSQDPYQDLQEEYEMDKYFLKMSGLNQWLSLCVDLEKIAVKRRICYLKWLTYFKSKPFDNVRPLFNELPDGVVPFAFPVLAEKRPDFIMQLWQDGIQSFPWPYLPKDSQEDFFSQRMVCLPVWTEADFTKLPDLKEKVPCLL